MFDLISIGDAVIDTFIPLIDAEVTSEDNDKKLCLRYGDKIPVGPATALVAGNAANNAIGASRLKLSTAIYVHVGLDANGERIKNKLTDENIDPRYITFEKELPSNHHIVLDFKGERTILVYHQPWEYNLPDLEKSKWVYFTSLSPFFIKSNLVNQLTQYIERTNTRLVYNPGTFQINSGIKKDPRLLSLTEVFIVNLDEAKIILGYDEAEKQKVGKLLKELLDLGPKKVIITDGVNGSYGTDGDNYYKLEKFPATVVEMTGAGDSYATGVLAAMFYGKDLPEAMRWGTANGASVIEQIGPQAGLLTYSKMQEKLKKHSSIITKDLK